MEKQQLSTPNLLLEHVRDLLGDPQLLRMLVAADLVRTVPTVARTEALAALVSACVAGDAPALLVEPEPGGEPSVITRAALGGVLLDWYAAARAS